MYYPNTLTSFAKMLIGFHDIYRRMLKNIYPWTNLRGAIKKKKLPNFGHRPNMGGGQRRSQTFYQKKVWTCFKGGGGSKGLVQSSFLQKKSTYFKSMNSFLVLNWSTCFKTYGLQYHIPTQALSEKFHFLIYQKLIFCVKISKQR